MIIGIVEFNNENVPTIIHYVHFCKWFIRPHIIHYIFPKGHG